MCAKNGLILLLLVLALAGCASPHKLPEAPTPIPRLIPATLPPGSKPSVQPAAEVGALAPSGVQDVAKPSTRGGVVPVTLSPASPVRLAPSGPILRAWAS